MISVVNGRNAELSRPGKELDPRLMELETATAGFLIDVAALLRTPKFANEDLEPVIETLDQTEMLLIVINNLCLRRNYMDYNETTTKENNMFEQYANPEAVAARAAELSLEQLSRLESYLKKNGPDSAGDFYKQGFEIGQSNNIARLMGGYAKLMGYVK